MIPLKEAAVMSKLADRLAALRAKFNLLHKPEIRETAERHIEELRKTGAVDRALNTGEIAPSFLLPDQLGTAVSSADLLERGPLVISFYRGTWCPYCNEDLIALNAAYERVRTLGAELLAISPQSSANARAYFDKHPVRFPVLVDRDADVAASFGLAFTLPPYLIDLYKRAFRNDLARVNEGGTWRLPIPSRFVIARDGTIVHAEADADYRFRPEPDSVITELERLVTRASRFPFSSRSVS